jgi:undecaprenyl-diphosphatase
LALGKTFVSLSESAMTVAEHLRRFRMLYLAVVVAGVGIWAFVELAEDYPEGRYRVFDELVLRSLRNPADPAVPRGPAWLKEMVRDVSALGSTFVLTFVVIATAAVLFVRRANRPALAILLTSIGGTILSTFLKSFADRPRPSVVPHLVEVTTTSFPSGHSLLSAAIYLSIAGILTHGAGWTLAMVAFGFAILLTALVGLSRVYLGVHFPSDVLAGWAVGTVWSMLCLSIAAKFCRAPVARRS